MTDFILAEKPSAAFAIAKSLGDYTKKKYKTVSYYVVDTATGSQIVIASAVGHMLNLTKERGTKDWSYVWGFEWLPVWENNKNLAYVKKYFDCVRFLVHEQEYDRYIIGCDFDIEGLVIGVITFSALKVNFEKVYWMKMNSLAKYDVEKAYNSLVSPDMNWFSAGEARHEIDAVYGLNLTTLFTLLARKYGKKFKVISLGRVQTPTLSFIVDRENAIRNFVPEKLYNVRLTLDINGKQWCVFSSCVDIKDKTKAEEIASKCRTSEFCEVADVKSEDDSKSPFHCFNLSHLEQEAWRYFRMIPHDTDYIAQNLYQEGLISYPRTRTTNILGVPYNVVLNSLKNDSEYTEFVKNARVALRSGGISDGSHLCIYPTGKEADIDEKSARVLDMIKRRFIATFYDDLILKKTRITFYCGSSFFFILGSEVVVFGWTVVYSYYKPKTNEVPNVVVGNKFKVLAVDVLERETTPPFRYNFASLVKEMETSKIGTQATRADICKKLQDRGYIYSEAGTGIRPTVLGEKLITLVKEHCNVLSDVELTRELERNLFCIEKASVKKNEIIDQVKIFIRGVIDSVEKKSDDIGYELAKVI